MNTFHNCVLKCGCFSILFLKAIASYEDGMIKMTNTPVDPNSKVKQQVIHRERVDDEIILVRTYT